MPADSAAAEFADELNAFLASDAERRYRSLYRGLAKKRGANPEPGRPEVKPPWLDGVTASKFGSAFEVSENRESNIRIGGDVILSLYLEAARILAACAAAFYGAVVTATAKGDHIEVKFELAYLDRAANKPPF